MAVAAPGHRVGCDAQGEVADPLELVPRPVRKALQILVQPAHGSILRPPAGCGPSGVVRTAGGKRSFAGLPSDAYWIP